MSRARDATTEAADRRARISSHHIRSGSVWVGGSCQGAPVVVPCRGTAVAVAVPPTWVMPAMARIAVGRGGVGGDGDGGPGDGHVPGDATGGEDRLGGCPCGAGVRGESGGSGGAEGGVVEGVGAGPGGLLGGVRGRAVGGQRGARRPAPAPPGGPGRRS